MGSTRIRYFTIERNENRFKTLGFLEKLHLKFPFFSNSFLVGTVGRLVEIKNHRMLIDAALELKQRGSLEPYVFIIIGDGELRPNLEKYVKKFNLNHHFLFAGWQKDMPSIYQCLDMVVLTSLNEGTPVSLIESMASGTPVVSTEVGGVRDLFGREMDGKTLDFKIAEYGILIPSNSPQSLAQAISFVKDNQPTIRDMAKKAKSFVLERYTRERLIKDMEHLYSELIN